MLEVLLFLIKYKFLSILLIIHFFFKDRPVAQINFDISQAHSILSDIITTCSARDNYWNITYYYYI